jgi:Zn-dependent peptidase ImmA (M78 family)
MEINKERLEYIKIKVNSLRKYLEIKSYPIMMEDLLKKHFYSRCLIRYLPLPDSIDAVSEYHQELKKLVIVINSFKTKGFMRKRLNFSLAHELGHLVLEHYNEFKDNPPNDRVQELEDEANEFAGLLLVNEYKLRKDRRCQTAFWSDYFFVSQEVVRIRKERIGIHTCYFKL